MGRRVLRNRCPMCPGKKLWYRKYCSDRCAHRAAVRAYQRRESAQGNCITCGKPRVHYKNHCDIHAVAQAKNHRNKNGFKPWQEGSTRGRKPRVAMAA